jgi:hypothetical protein
VSLLPPPDPASLVHDRFAAGVSVARVAVGGEATAEETAAIMAAIEHLWPRPVLVTTETSPETATWRFSGRWWSRPSVTRRDRPWVR